MRAYFMYTYTRKCWMNGGENFKLKRRSRITATMKKTM